MTRTVNGGVHVLQRFATVAGKPWYALQRQHDGGVAWQWTGYRSEMEEFVSRLGIVPEEREPVTEEEFLSRFEE